MKDTPLPRLLVLILVAHTFSTFLSETRFVPDIRTNVGFFEVTGALLIGVALIFYFQTNLPLCFHPLLALLGIWLVVAMISLFHYLSPRIDIGVTSDLILAFQLFLSVTVFNLLTLDKRFIPVILRMFAFSVGVIGVWVLVDQLTNPFDFNAAGPFRSRSHMGIYMMGGFWMVIVYRVWPGTKPWEHWITYPILALALYAQAASLRQSVYVGMVIGGLGLAIGILFASGWGRIRGLVAVAIATTFLVWLFLFGGFYLKSLALFNREFVDLGPATGLVAEENAPEEFNFRQAQLNAALRAFNDHPWLGIGWGAFYRSEYAPTRHEIHSTPVRFIAELGVTGIAIYVAFHAILLIGGFKLLARCWNSPYRLVAFVMLVGLISFATSHYYNRMFTDRPYWWFLIFFMVFDAILLKEPKVTVSEASTAVPASAG